MQQPPAASASSNGVHTYENDILSDMERLLDERPVAAIIAPATRRRVRLLAPLVLLASVGVVLALVPFGVKDALMTGRSVAHAPDR